MTGSHCPCFLISKHQKAWEGNEMLAVVTPPSAQSAHGSARLSQPHARAWLLSQGSRSTQSCSHHKKVGPLLWRPSCLDFQGILWISVWGPLCPHMGARLAWLGCRTALLLMVSVEHLTTLLWSPFFFSSEVKFE